MLLPPSSKVHQVQELVIPLEQAVPLDVLRNILVVCANSELTRLEACIEVDRLLVEQAEQKILEWIPHWKK